MQKKLQLYIVLLLLANGMQGQRVFTSLDSLLNYAGRTSIALQSGNIKWQQAKKAKLAAVLSIPEVTGGLSGSYTNNTRQPVNLFPAEVFGGQPGTFREVQAGVQYVTNFNENIDVKLVNLKGWEGVKLARLNLDVTTSDNTMALRSLYDNIATTYFNIITLQEQLACTKQQVEAADALLKIVAQRHRQGLIKQQDVNDARVNKLSHTANVQQLQHLAEQQYLALKILCDIPETDSMQIFEPVTPAANSPLPAVATSTLGIQNSLLKEKMAWSAYKQYKYALYPTLSFFQSASRQQNNTRGKLFDNRVNWIPSSFIGLRLNIPIPGASSIAQVSKARFDYQLAQKNTEQQQIRAVLEAKQLLVAWQKATAQAGYDKEIYELRRDTYQKNYLLYQEGLTGLDNTLNSFATLVTSQYNLVTSTVSIMLAKAKIDINNRIQ